MGCGVSSPIRSRECFCCPYCGLPFPTAAGCSGHEATCLLKFSCSTCRVFASRAMDHDHLLLDCDEKPGCFTVGNQRLQQRQRPGGRDDVIQYLIPGYMHKSHEDTWVDGGFVYFCPSFVVDVRESPSAASSAAGGAEGNGRDRDESGCPMEALRRWRGYDATDDTWEPLGQSDPCFHRFCSSCVGMWICASCGARVALLSTSCHRCSAKRRVRWMVEVDPNKSVALSVWTTLQVELAVQQGLPAVSCSLYDPTQKSLAGINKRIDVEFDLVNMTQRHTSTNATLKIIRSPPIESDWIGTMKMRRRPVAVVDMVTLTKPSRVVWYLLRYSSEHNNSAPQSGDGEDDKGKKMSLAMTRDEDGEAEWVLEPPHALKQAFLASLEWFCAACRTIVTGFESQCPYCLLQHVHVVWEENDFVSSIASKYYWRPFSAVETYALESAFMRGETETAPRTWTSLAITQPLLPSAERFGKVDLRKMCRVAPKSHEATCCVSPLIRRNLTVLAPRERQAYLARMCELYRLNSDRATLRSSGESDSTSYLIRDDDALAALVLRITHTALFFDTELDLGPGVTVELMIHRCLALPDLSILARANLLGQLSVIWYNGELGVASADKNKARFYALQSLGCCPNPTGAQFAGLTEIQPTTTSGGGGGGDGNPSYAEKAFHIASGDSDWIPITRWMSCFNPRSEKDAKRVFCRLLSEDLFQEYPAESLFVMAMPTGELRYSGADLRGEIHKAFVKAAGYFWSTKTSVVVPSPNGISSLPFTRIRIAKLLSGLASSGALSQVVYNVKGIDNGRAAWYYVIVHGLDEAFKVALKDEIIHLEEHGVIILSAYGSDPPAAATEKMKRWFGIDKEEKVIPIAADAPYASLRRANFTQVGTVVPDKVFIVSKSRTHERFILRIYTSSERSVYLKECHVHRQLAETNPFLAELHANFTDEDANCHCLLSSHYSGLSLGHWVSMWCDDGEALLRVLVQVMCGLAALHRARVVHGSFKAESVLMNSALVSAQPRIWDFSAALSPSGRAALIAKSAKAKMEPSATSCVPPEVAQVLLSQPPANAKEDPVIPDKLVTPAIDMYDAGQLLRELITGEQAPSAAQTWRYPTDSGAGGSLSVQHAVAATLRPFAQEVESLVHRLTDADPKNRPSAVQVRRELQTLHDRSQEGLNEAVRLQRQFLQCTLCSCSTTRDKMVACSAGGAHKFCFAEAEEGGGTCLASMLRSWSQTDLEILAGRHERERVVCGWGGCTGILHRDVLWSVLDCGSRTIYEATQRRVAEFITMSQQEHHNYPVERVMEIVNQFIVQRCPNPDCRRMFVVDFEHCLAMTCSPGVCDTQFCGYCMTIYPDSKSTHACPCFSRPESDRPMFANTPQQQEAYRRHRLNEARPAIEAFLALQKRSIAEEVRSRLGL